MAGGRRRSACPRTGVLGSAIAWAATAAPLLQAGSPREHRPLIATSLNCGNPERQSGRVCNRNLSSRRGSQIAITDIRDHHPQGEERNEVVMEGWTARRDRSPDSRHVCALAWLVRGELSDSEQEHRCHAGWCRVHRVHIGEYLVIEATLRKRIARAGFMNRTWSTPGLVSRASRRNG